MEIPPGTLDLIVLQTLASTGPQHGYAIAARIEQASGGSLQLIWGLFIRPWSGLSSAASIRARWDTTENSRRARFYDLTAAGRKQLGKEKAGCLLMAEIMSRMLGQEV